MTDNQSLLYIEDSHKRKLFYRFTPAALISNFVPLIVILHDEDVTNAPHFEYKMWNVLTPIDNFGYEKKGSCWLGEDGDFFVKDLLQELIRQIAQEYECEDHIYFYGSSSMGGYGAILHGTLCKANAVYAQAPMIKVPDQNQLGVQRQQFYHYVFGEKVSQEKDLNSLLNPRDTFPILFLGDTPGDVRHQENAIEGFIKACQKNGIKYRLDFSPRSKDENEAVKELLDMLERVSSA